MSRTFLLFVVVTLIAVASLGAAQPESCSKKVESYCEGMRERTMCSAAVDCIVEGLEEDKCKTDMDKYIASNMCRCVRDNCASDWSSSLEPLPHLAHLVPTFDCNGDSLYLG